jgi:hypothetical protein
VSRVSEALLSLLLLLLLLLASKRKNVDHYVDLHGVQSLPAATPEKRWKPGKQPW